MSDLIETLTSYVPTLISRRLAIDPTPIDAPASERFSAAVLFADISGFTALTERLAQLGPAGAEELTYLLNTYFDHLINLISASGGDVVKFAGDALIALWPAADESWLAEATQRAAQCGLAAQQQLHNYPVTPEVRLSLKIILGAGEVLTMHLGGEYGRWEFLVTGAPMVQVGQAAAYAGPGDVILSPAAWQLVKDYAVGGPHLPPPLTRKEAGAASPPAFRLAELRLPGVVAGVPGPNGRSTRSLPVEAEAGLRAYIPGAILARIAARQSDWLAELRRVTVLFVNLPDLDYTMPLDQAQAVMETLQQTLYRYEGSINKLSVDEKGVTLIAALGLPPLAHADDPERGVRAGLAMQAQLCRMGLSSAVGITTGRVFCGSIGNRQRRDYTIMGDVVNLAARLMQHAPDDILCDDATYQAVRSTIKCEALEPIQVKGKARPIAINRPLGEKAPSFRPETNLVGREAERNRLEEQLQSYLRGQGGIILIEGETGMGKSRLLEELLDRAAALGLAILAGGGSSIDKSTPYHAWRPIFKELLELDAMPDDPAGQRAHLLARLEEQAAPGDQHWLQLAPLLKAVLPLDWPENELTGQMTGKVRADNTHELLLHLLQQAVDQGHRNGRPCLLVFDDAHWFDSASWTMARLVANQIKPLLLVLVSRPITDQPPLEYSELRGSAVTELISLERLSLADTAAFVAECLGVERLPESLPQLIYRKAEGNPLFSEELAYALRDSGFISVNDGQCRLTSKTTNLQALNLPDTVQGIITGRIDRLPPSQQLTLKVASVIGRLFEYETLHHIHPIEADKAHLPEYLDTLDRLDITQLEEPEPELAYLFKQMTTQEVAYNMMLFSQRRELHRAVAQWYEASYADDLSSFYALLAYHWRSADDIPRAIDYLEQAGDQALHNYANEEAVEFFSEALMLARQETGRAGTPPAELRQGYWEISLGQAYVNWARLSEGQTHFERGLTLLGYPLPRGKISLILGLARQIVRQLRCQVWPGCRVGSRAANRDRLLAAARAYEGLTAIYYFANQDLLTLYAAYRSLNLAEAAGPSPELARGYASVGVINSFIPFHRLARAYCRRALDMARQIDNLPAQAWVALLSGIYYAGVGQWSTARELLEQTIEIAGRLGDHSRWADGTGNLAMVDYFSGRFNQSARRYTDLLASAARRQDAHNQAWALRGQVYCLLVQGEFQEALARLHTIRDLLAQNPDIVDEALNIDRHGLLALVHLRRGDAEAALKAARTALDLIAQSSPTSFLSLPGYAGVAETLLYLWETGSLAGGQQLEKLGRAACKALHNYARVFPIGRPRAYLWQGLLEWLRGRPGPARRLWAKSLAAARQMEMPYAAGLALYELGRHLPADDPRRPEHLAQAGRIFSQLEAPYDLQRTEEAMK